MDVVPLGNAHLARWSDTLLQRRSQTREAFGWQQKAIVLNVCRFHRSERLYKGVDKFLDVAVQMRLVHPSADLVFVLCGRADEEDVAEAQSFGIEVFANVTDEQLIDIYCAADIYANFSKWEGYNLGIGQALAMGLPVVGSDIPAHRAFPIWTSNETNQIVDQLLMLAEARADFERCPIITEWEPSHARFAEILRECITDATEKAGA
jgi:hypothetical protein